MRVVFRHARQLLQALRHGRGVDPQDWDVATSAKPDEIQRLFRRSLYTNRFGTVVVHSGAHEVEVTTYRIEADYADHRRPEEVAFTESLHEDLALRLQSSIPVVVALLGFGGLAAILWLMIFKPM